MTRRVLYLTADGLLQPLGFSQVVRVVEGLAAQGWRYAITSLERAADLARSDRLDAVRARLVRAGVDWTPLPWDDSGGGLAAARNELTLCYAAVAHARRGCIAGIHARSYHGAVAGMVSWLATGTPYVFDTRSYWFDERLEEGRWFTSPIRLGVARGVEHQLYARAAAVVTLTELHANDVRSGRFGANGVRPVRCITTVADFDEFVRRAPETCLSIPASIRAGLRGKLVVGIVGSINSSYLVNETLKLVGMVFERNPHAHLLILSGQREEYERRLAALGIDRARVTIERAEHEAMPEWLTLMNWGLLLLQPRSAAKRASMPTKLAEFFAMGVRPVQFGCNDEVSSWVAQTGSGLVLDGVDESSLSRAADVIASHHLPDSALKRARDIASQHFALECAIRDYDALLTELSAAGVLVGARS